MRSLTPARWHYLDTMRGMLMLLGVVLHAARPYSSEPWRVSDPDKIGVAHALTEGVHLFRMPAFFVIAGFFAMYLLGTRPTAAFLRERMRRVLVPLVVMLLTVNMAQLWFESHVVNPGSGDFVTEILPGAFWSGDLSSHLWFLGCLAIYFALTAIAAPFLRRLPIRSGDTANVMVLFHFVLAAAVLAPLAIAAIGQATAPLLSKHMLGVVRVSNALENLPFFAIGVVLCAYPSLLDRFARVTGWVVALAALAIVGIILGAGREPVGWKALHIVSWSLLAWMAVRAVFWLFRSFADRPSRTFRYLSEASYSVYLFHHIVVIMVATWLLDADIAAWLKFAIVLTSASLVSLAAYHWLVRAHALPRYLFNGAVRPASSTRVDGMRPDSYRGQASTLPQVAAAAAVAATGRGSEWAGTGERAQAGAVKWPADPARGVGPASD